MTVDVDWDWLQALAWVKGRTLDDVREVERLRQEAPDHGHEAEGHIAFQLWSRDPEALKAAGQEIHAACLAGRITARGWNDGPLVSIAADRWSGGKVYNTSQGGWALGYENLSSRQAMRDTDWFGLRFRSDEIRRHFPHPRDAALHFVPMASRFDVLTGEEVFNLAFFGKPTDLGDLGSEYQDAAAEGGQAMARALMSLSEALAGGNLTAYVSTDDGSLHRIPRGYWMRERDPKPAHETSRILFAHPYQLSDDLSDIGWREDLRSRPVVVRADELPKWEEIVAASRVDAVPIPEQARRRTRSRRPNAQQTSAGAFFGQAKTGGLLEGGEKPCSMEDLYNCHYTPWLERQARASQRSAAIPDPGAPYKFSAFKKWLKLFNDGDWPFPLATTRPR